MLWWNHFCNRYKDDYKNRSSKEWFVIISARMVHLTMENCAGKTDSPIQNSRPKNTSQKNGQHSVLLLYTKPPTYSCLGDTSGSSPGSLWAQQGMEPCHPFLPSPGPLCDQQGMGPSGGSRNLLLVSLAETSKKQDWIWARPMSTVFVWQPHFRLPGQVLWHCGTEVGRCGRIWAAFFRAQPGTPSHT